MSEDAMIRYRYTLALPHFSGEVQAEDEDEARTVAREDAAEQLSWNSAWWSCADVTTEVIPDDSDRST
jgi:hypothetical protein